MPTWLRRIGSTLLVLLLIAYAYAPVLTAGLRGGEFQTLVDVERVVRPPDGTPLLQRLGGLFEVHGSPRRVLAGASLAFSRSLPPGGVGPGALVVLRVENLLLLLGAAACFGAFVKRLLWSWTGSEQAVAAGRAAALLIALQPLHGAAVASAVARGDLLALLFGGAGGALFLKGRQERRYELTLVAALCALLAGAASRLALALPMVMAVAEFTSSRRYRAPHRRLRTAGTTLLVWGLCVLLPPAVGELLGFAGPAAQGLPAGGPAGQIAVGLERLGALVLPINAVAVGPLGFALAGAVVLVALQPAFVAARSAPRLWGWMLTGWALVTLVSELISAPVRVHPGDVTNAATLLPASVAASIGLGVACTAISGLRRALLPFVLAGAWALLAHQNGGAWSAAARTAADFQHDLAAARERWRGGDARLLAVDPPRLVAGVDAVGGALPWMLDPLFVPAPASSPPAAGAPGVEAVRVRAISRRGLAALAREVEFELLRSNPLIVIYPLEAADGGGRDSVRLEPVEAFSHQRSFYGEGGFDPDVPSVGARALVATVKEPPATHAPPRLGWRSTGAGPTEAEGGELAGVWLVDEDGARAVFDLCASLEWLLSPRVKSIFSAGGWSRVTEGALLDALPVPSLEGPRASGEDWIFVPGAELVGTGVWGLELLELGELAFEELPLERDAAGRWIVRGAERRVGHLLAGGRGPVAWSLLRRVEGTAVERLGGRRE